MKYYETEEVPAKTRKRLVSTTCDMCGGVIDPRNYEIDEVTVSYKTGKLFPEGGQGEEVSMDMCGDCFELKLRPWLESEGVLLTETDWDV